MKNSFLIFLFCFAFFLGPAEETKKINQFSYSLKADLSKTDLDENARKIAEIFLKISMLGNQLNQSGISDQKREKTTGEIAALLKSAEETESDSKMKLYLSALSGDITKGNFGSSQSKWLDLEKPEIDILYHVDSDSRVKVSVLYYDKKWTSKAGRYVSLIDKMKANTTRKYFSVLTSVSFRYPILVADLLQGTGIDRIILDYPPPQEGHESEGMKIIILRNMARIFFKGILKPLSEKVFPPRSARLVDFSSFLSYLIMHKISHFLGPYFAKSKSEEPELIAKKLKDLFICIEEVKADTVALCNSDLLVKEKIVAERRKKRIFAAYIIGLIAKLRQNQNNLEKNPYLIQLNYYLANQGLVYSLENQVLVIDFEKLKKAIKDLMEMVLKIEPSGKHPGAQRFVENYSVMPQELLLILEKTKSVPATIKPKNIGSANKSE